MSHPDSLLAKMFDGGFELKEIEGYVFIDRNGYMFEMMLDFLRNDCEQWP
jgi:hypothetical protein